MMDDGTLETVVGLLFAALVIVFVALGCVLLAYFWGRQLSVTLRAVFATGLACAVLVVPLTIISGEGVLPLIGGSVIVGVLGFPVAFLAARKLERRHRSEQDQGVAAIFD